jgi:two-component system, LytTR family, sensor kinase
MPVGPFALDRPKPAHWATAYALFATATGGLFFYKYLDFVARGHQISPLIPLLEEFTGMVGMVIFFPLIHEAAIRFPPIGRHWWRNVPLHVSLLLVISFLHTSFMFGSRRLIWPKVGLGEYDYGEMKVRYFMELANDFSVYLSMLGMIFLYHYFRYSKRQEVDKARLEASLARAQLQNLRLQIEPHFLFNAMNAISSVVYESPRVADEMIGRLSDLLRQVLKEDRSQEIPLSEELELVRLYTRVMESRLEDRLQVDIRVEDGGEAALVPQLVLQPLVENAIKYGINPLTFQVHVEVAAIRQNGHLQITVRDHGPGWPKTAFNEGGIGLRNTEARLSRLYGEDQSLLKSNAQDGGAIVEVRVPFRTGNCPYSTFAG